MNLFANIVVIALLVFVVYVRWHVYTKANKPGFASLVPFYTEYIYFDIAFNKGWLFIVPYSLLLLIYIPVIRVIALIAIIIIIFISRIKMANAYGQGFAFGIGLVFLPFIFMTIIALNKNIKYVYDNDDDDFDDDDYYDGPNDLDNLNKLNEANFRSMNDDLSIKNFGGL